MLGNSSNNAVITAPTNVGLTAFQVAVVQAKVFKKTLAEVSDRADQTAKELEHKAELQRQAVRERLAAQRGGVDVLIGDTKSAAKQDPKQSPNREPDQAAKPQAPGGGVDIKV